MDLDELLSKVFCFSVGVMFGMWITETSPGGG